MKKKVCKACARALKETTAMKRGLPTTVLVCKSPVCRLYGKPQ